MNSFINKIFQARFYIISTWYLSQVHSFETSKLFHWFHPLTQILQAPSLEICKFSQEIITLFFVSISSSFSKKIFNFQRYKVYILPFYKYFLNQFHYFQYFCSRVACSFNCLNIPMKHRYQ